MKVSPMGGTFLFRQSISFLKYTLARSVIMLYFQTLIETMKLVCCILMLFVIFACSHNNNEPVYNNCVLKAIITNGDTSSSKATFDYDTLGRLVRINYPQSHTLQIAYADHQITTTETNSYQRYILGNDSMAKYRIGNNGSSVDSTVYQYVSERYLVKQVLYIDRIFYDSVIYKYMNGNRVNWTRYNQTGITDYSDLKYDENLFVKTWYLQTLGSWPDGYFPFLGKPNKNLIIEQKIPAWSTWFTISYKMNASGYVTHIRYKNEAAGGATSDHDVVYDCQ